MTFTSKYPMIVQGGGVTKTFEHDSVDGLLGADTFSIDFDVTAIGTGGSGEIFRFGSDLVAYVDAAGELSIDANTDNGMAELRTSGANLNDARPHDVEIGYTDGRLAVSIDGKAVGSVEMSPLVSDEDSDFHVGNPWDGENFASKIGSLTIAASEMDPDTDEASDDYDGQDPGTGVDEDTAPEDEAPALTPDPAPEEEDVPAAEEENAPDNEEEPAVGTGQVVNLAGLYDALSKADGGETVLLQGGDYGAFDLNQQSGFDYRFTSEVTIASADPSDPAKFSEMNIRDAANLTFDGVTFDYDFDGSDPYHIRPFVVNSGENIAIRNSVFDGDLARGISGVDDGHGWGTGLSARNITNMTLEGTEFYEFRKGAILDDIDELVVRGNDIHTMRMDGLNFTAVQDVLIEGNHLHDFDRAFDSSDHADMIQFWSNQADRPSVDVIIRGNTLDIGEGGWTQSIFMRNEEVDNGRAGYEMFYRDITIEDNLIVNGHRHGITVGETDGLTIRGNSILHADGRLQDGADSQVEIPQINVGSASRNVTVKDNLTSGVNVDSGSGRSISGNIIVQDQNPDAPGYYDDVFLSSSLQAQDGSHMFLAHPGGPVDRAGAGASATRDPGEGLRSSFQIETVDEDASVRIFDGAHTSLDGSPVGDGASFEWRFSDGTKVTDSVFATVFENGGEKSVDLTVTLPDGTSRSVSHDFDVTGPEVLEFGAGTGLIVDGGDAVDVDGIGDRGVDLDMSGVATEIPREHVIDLVRSDEFSIDFTIDGSADDASGGLFRLGTSLIASVRNDGDILIKASGEDGMIRFETSGQSVNDGEDHWVEIDLLDGVLQVAIDGQVAGRSEIDSVSDNSGHGLYLGDPWGGNFGSTLSDFEITANASDFASTNTDAISSLSAFDPLVMG